MLPEDEARLIEINKSIILTLSLLMTPANILMGLGLYGIFAANGNAFMNILNDKTFCYLITAIGVIIDGIALIKFMKLVYEKGQISTKK